MATFISLLNFTDQGIRNIKESPNRAEAAIALMSKLGATVKSMHWTAGAYDMVVISEGTDEAAMTAMLTTAMMGNVRTQTLRAFNAGEMKKIIANMP